MNILILGSSGMVGSELLNQCIHNKNITKITVINRKPIIKHKKVTEIIHEDFNDFRKIKNKIKDNDICFYCIGAYQGEVKEQQFIEITYTYLKALLNTIESKKTIFCLFSAQGANEKSKILFAKWKGEAELLLQERKFKRTYILRPGYIHPTDATRRRKTLLYKTTGFLYPLLNIFLPQYCTNSTQLAKAMIKVTLEGYEKTILENRDIREI